MKAVIWTNAALALPFILAWSGIPLWMVIRHPDTKPDFTQARSYLAAKAAPEAPAAAKTTAAEREPVSA